MYKKIIAVVALLFLTMGCAALGGMEVREEKYGKSIPVITQSFASKQLRPRDTWKVYLNASDPDGDMKNIVCVIEQPGRGVYPASRTRIAMENRKDLSGFIYLNTVGVEGLNFVILTLTVQIEDKAGHFSQAAVFPLSFNSSYKQESPRPGTFQEKDLGPIMITLRPIDDGGSHGDFDGH